MTPRSVQQEKSKGTMEEGVKESREMRGTFIRSRQEVTEGSGTTKVKRNITMSGTGSKKGALKKGRHHSEKCISNPCQTDNLKGTWERKRELEKANPLTARRKEEENPRPHHPQRYFLSLRYQRTSGSEVRMGKRRYAKRGRRSPGKRTTQGAGARPTEKINRGGLDSLGGGLEDWRRTKGPRGGRKNDSFLGASRGGGHRPSILEEEEWDLLMAKREERKAFEEEK